MLRRLPHRRTILALDILVVLWIAAWVVLGLRVHTEVEGLRELSATISRAGGAVEETGRALGGLNIPFVGGELDRTAQRVTEVGRETRLSGRTARESIGDLSTLLGISVAIIPSSPILFLYLPARITLERDRRAARRLAARAAHDPDLARLLEGPTFLGARPRHVERAVR